MSRLITYELPVEPATLAGRSVHRSGFGPLHFTGSPARRSRLGARISPRPRSQLQPCSSACIFLKLFTTAPIRAVCVS